MIDNLPAPRVRPIAICLFQWNDKILVFEGFDSVKQSHYYRPLGSGIEFGERATDTIRREIREEINQDAIDLKLLGVMENIFNCDGKAGHEIVFVFDGRFREAAVYGATLIVNEPGSAPSPAGWRAIHSFDERHQLVPQGLSNLLNHQRPGRI